MCQFLAYLFLFEHFTVLPHTAQKIKFSIKEFFSKCDQIHSFLRIWSHLMKKSLMENFFCAVAPPFTDTHSRIITLLLLIVVEKTVVALSNF